MLGKGILLAFAVGALAITQGCEAESDHGPTPYIQGQPPTTSKNTAYMYGSGIVGEEAPGPGVSVGGDFVDVGSPDVEEE